MSYMFLKVFFFFNDTATTEIYTLSLHDALPISQAAKASHRPQPCAGERRWTSSPPSVQHHVRSEEHTSELQSRENLVCRLLLEKKNTDVPTLPPRNSNRRSLPVPFVLPLLRRYAPSENASGFFFNDTATTEIYTLSLHDALPISPCSTTTCYAASPARSVSSTRCATRRSTS